MNEFTRARGIFFAVVGFMGAGCAAPVARAPAVTTLTTTAPQAGHSHNPGDHNHARGKMLLASDGTYNALLTAHLSSKTGNELDIFVEDKDGPFALSAKTLDATVKTPLSNRTLTFACAPAEERPANEAEGTCSHYVASAPWMKADDTLKVETKLAVGDREVPMAWRGFHPKTYAHHEE